MVHQVAGTKYAFADTYDREREGGVKVCPRCGQVLFEDMDICFDCLYSFEKDAHGFKPRLGSVVPDVVNGPPGMGIELPVSVPEHTDDPLDDIEIDEIDETDTDASEASMDEPMANARHRKREPDTQDDTLVFSELEPAKPVPPQPLQFRVVIRAKDMQVHIPVTQGGLTVGRGEDNDIVLRSRLVSRRHLSLTPLDDGVAAQDCGATNPTIIHGKPLEGSASVGAGDIIEICGITLEVEKAS